MKSKFFSRSIKSKIHQRGHWILQPGLSHEIGESREWVAFFRSLGCELGPVTGWSFPSNDPVRRARQAVSKRGCTDKRRRDARDEPREEDSSINRIRLPCGETPLTPPESLSPVIAALNFISAPICQEPQERYAHSGDTRASNVYYHDQLDG